MPTSLPVTTASINSDEKPSVGDHSSSGMDQDLRHLSSRNHDLQTANTQLGREVRELRDQKIELLNELEAVRESCFADVERARREASSNYDHQVTAGQQAFVESERRLQEVEMQLEDSKRAFKLLEDEHAQDLVDRDQNHARNIISLEQKHAEEVDRVREETRSQPMVRDADEEKAEWMKVIKDTMREKHVADRQALVEKLEAKKQEELMKCLEECQVKVDQQQQQMQTAANEQLQAYYQQWLKSCQALEEQNGKLRTELEQTKAEVEQRNVELEAQKAEADHLAASLRSEETGGEDRRAALGSLEAKCADVAREKDVLEEQCRALLKEVETLRESQIGKSDDVDGSLLQGESAWLDSRGELAESQSSDVLERSFKEWNEAASKLDEKLSTPEKPEEDRVFEIQNKEELKALRTLVGEYEIKLMNSETKHHQDLAQLEEKLTSVEFQREEEKAAKIHFEKEIESLRLHGEEYENRLREMKANQQQEILQVQSDGEKKSKEALQESRVENDRKVGELCTKYESEIERLKEAGAAAVDKHRQELSQLEEELASIEHHRAEEKTVCAQYEEELKSLRVECEELERNFSDTKAMHAEELSQLRSDADKHLKGRVLEIHQQNERKTDQIIARYEAEIERLQEANAASLNESMDRASLEVAEEHMKSLREQLNGYRNQEQSYESRLTEMGKNHSDAVVVIRKQCENDKNAAVSQVEKEADAKIEVLERKVSSLAKEKELVEVQFTASLKEAHQKDMDALETSMKAKMERTIADVRYVLESSHQEAVETLQQQLKMEFEVEKQELERNMRSKAEKERDKLKAIIEELKNTHRLQVSKLNDTISQAEEVFSKKYSGKIASLQEHISKLESDCEQSNLAQRDLASGLAVLQQQKQEIETALSRVEIERNQLCEDCDRYQKRDKTLEVDASISKSAEESMHKLLGEKTALLEEEQAALQAKVEEVAQLASSVEEFHSQVAELTERTHNLEAENSRVVDSLAAKEEEIASCKTELEGQLVVKGKELAAMELEVTRCLEDLAKKEEELRSCREDGRSSSEQLAMVKQEFETRNAEYQSIIDQLAAKNQAFVSLQVENDSLKTSLDSLRKRYQEEVDAREELKQHLEGRWGESEEMESLKQQVAELSSYKDGYRDMMLKLESLGEVVSNKEKLLVEASQSLLLASQRNERCEEENANYAKMVANLRHDLKLAEESKLELQKQVQSIEAVLIERSQAIKEMEKMIGELEKKAEQSDWNSQNVMEETRKEVEEKMRNISSKLKLAQSKEKLMLSELQEKEDAIRDLNLKLRETSQNSETQALKIERHIEELEELNSRLDVASKTEERLRSQLLEKERDISRLNKLANSDLESSSALNEMANEIESLRAVVSSLELEVAGKNTIIEELTRTLEDVKVKLSMADEEIDKLEKETSEMQQDLLQYQKDSRSTGAAEKWPEKYSELERVVSSMGKDKESLEAQVADLQRYTSHMDDLEARIKDQDKTIKDLRATLAGSSTTSSPNYRAQLGQDLLNNPLGATLTRARKTLAERLQERDTIEKELRFRRAKLERQLAEKQCLEHLLFEKKRFELELQNQKSLLKKELEELEFRNIMGGKPVSSN